MNKLDELKNNISAIEEKIGFSFKDKNLLILSFIHRSFVNENKKIVSEHNERLEFLGDTALNLVVSDYLYNKLEMQTEGSLSHIRSRLVNATICSKYFENLNLVSDLLLGKGEEKTELRGKESIYADAFEAIIGAIYLDQGFETVKKFILKNFKNIFDEVAVKPELDYKGKLQEYSQKKFGVPPVYEVIKEEGPEHLKTFYIDVIINNEKVASATGMSKKEAEQKAAEIALKIIEG
ncbi:MAG: ribonuclease III [Parachlamydiales bacterium]|nr:ribonuclease III [Parachlamydiales bacterium]